MKRAELLALAPKALGERRRVNHPNCKAGEDHKRRLFVVRTARGVWAHCWHCGKSYFTNSAVTGLEALDSLAPEQTASCNMTDATEEGLAWWNGLAKPTPRTLPAVAAWLKKKKLSRHAISAFRLDGDVFYIPIFATRRDGAIELAGCQSRYFGSGKLPGPKYLNERWHTSQIAPGVAVLGTMRATPWGTEWLHHETPSSTLFVVEGLAEACYLADAGFMAAPLYGNSLSREAALMLGKTPGVKSIVVWLDNDRPDIVEQSLNITSFLNLIVPTNALLQYSAPNDLPESEFLRVVTAYEQH